MGYPSFNTGDILAASDMNAVGLWKINTTTFTNEAAKSIDNVFSADYTNYKIVVQLYGSSDNNFAFLRLINSTGTERATNYYAASWGVDYASAPTTIYSTGTRTTDMPVGYMSNTSASNLPVTADIVIGNPWSTSTYTTLAGVWSGVQAGTRFFGGICNGAYNAAERHRGFWVRNTSATGMYGTVSVYGYRN